jgi:uncharacterized membrane protein
MDSSSGSASGAGSARNVPEVHDPKDVQDNKDIAAFSYLWIMSIFVYVIKGSSPFVRFHSRQAIVLFILSLPTLFIPVVGRLLAFIILCIMALGFVNAAQGKWKDIPIIGQLSRSEITIRQAWRQLVDLIGRWTGGSKRNSSHSDPPPSPHP